MICLYDLTELGQAILALSQTQTFQVCDHSNAWRVKEQTRLTRKQHQLPVEMQCRTYVYIFEKWLLQFVLIIFCLDKVFFFCTYKCRYLSLSSIRISTKSLPQNMFFMGRETSFFLIKKTLYIWKISLLELNQTLRSENDFLVFGRYWPLVDSGIDDKTAPQKISQNISKELWGLPPPPCKQMGHGPN